MDTTYSVTRGAGLLPSDENKYFVTINGYLELDGRTIGRLKATKILLSDMVNDRESWFDNCDAVDQLTHDVWYAICEIKGYSYRKFLSDVMIGDILLLESVEIIDGFRGRGLGQALALDAIQMFQHGCGVIVIEPHPLRYFIEKPDGTHVERFEFEGQTAKEWHQSMGPEKLAQTEEQLADGAERLRRYWAKLHFKVVPNTKKRFAYRRTDLAYKDPTFDTFDED